MPIWYDSEHERFPNSFKSTVLNRYSPRPLGVISQLAPLAGNAPVGICRNWSSNRLGFSRDRAANTQNDPDAYGEQDHEHDGDLQNWAKKLRALPFLGQPPPVRAARHAPALVA
jgi:hypothetical protein